MSNPLASQKFVTLLGIIASLFGVPPADTAAATKGLADVNSIIDDIKTMHGDDTVAQPAVTAAIQQIAQAAAAAPTTAQPTAEVVAAVQETQEETDAEKKIAADEAALDAEKVELTKMKGTKASK